MAALDLRPGAAPVVGVDKIREPMAAILRTPIIVLVAFALSASALAYDEDEEPARRERAAALLAANIWAQLRAQDNLGDVDTIAVAPLFDDRDGALRRAILTGPGHGRFAVLSDLSVQQREELRAMAWRGGENDVVEPEMVKRVAAVAEADAVLYGRVVLDVTDYDPDMSVGDSYSIAKMKLADGDTGELLWLDWNDAAGSRNPPRDPFTAAPGASEKDKELKAEAFSSVKTGLIALGVLVALVFAAGVYLHRPRGG